MTDNRHRSAGTTRVTAHAVPSNLHHPYPRALPPNSQTVPEGGDPRALPPNNPQLSCAVTYSEERSSIYSQNISTLDSIRKGQDPTNAVGGSGVINITARDGDNEEGKGGGKRGKGEGDGKVEAEGEGEGEGDVSDDDLDSPFPRRRKAAQEVR